ncbi:MAG: hypothetical protein AAFX85_19930 [Pseudomonadota bacterium]
MTIARTEWPTLPATLFISHAYADDAAVSHLIRLLSEHAPHVRPQIFDAQEPDPRLAVSNGIVSTIRACEGLIYLGSRASQESLWVNFEKDYARRTRRVVYAFDPATETLHLDTEAPIPLDISVLVGPQTQTRAEGLLEWLEHERHFHIHRPPTFVRMKEIPDLVASVLVEGGVSVWLLDDRLGATAHLAFDLEEEYLADDVSWRAGRLDGGPYDYDLRDYPRWMLEHALFARLDASFTLAQSDDPDLQAFIVGEYFVERQFAQGWGVDLLGTSPTQGEVDWNRADDLIVRLTLMLQRARPFLRATEED